MKLCHNYIKNISIKTYRKAKVLYLGSKVNKSKSSHNGIEGERRIKPKIVFLYMGHWKEKGEYVEKYGKLLTKSQEEWRNEVLEEGKELYIDIRSREILEKSIKTASILYFIVIFLFLLLLTYSAMQSIIKSLLTSLIVSSILTLIIYLLMKNDSKTRKDSYATKKAIREILNRDKRYIEIARLNAKEAKKDKELEDKILKDLT